jgi:glycosyltransferase involved in cell wall biosynthesis
MKKKILIIYSGDISRNATGGIKNYIIEFTKNRNDVDFDVLAVCNGEIPDDLRAKNIYVLKTRFRPVIISFIAQVIYKRILGKLKFSIYDIVIINRHEEWLLIPFLKAAKSILMIHGSVKYGFKVWPRYIALLNAWFERIVVKNIDSVYVLLNNKEYGVPFYRIIHKKNAFKIHYAPVPISRCFIELCSKPLIKDGKCLRLIYFGRVVDNPKNVMMLPDIAQSFLRKEHDVRLTVAGQGADLTKLKELVKTMGLNEYFVFEGNLTGTNLANVVAGNHLSLILSSFEGICMSAIESLMLGVPVAAMPVGDITEYIHDMENGILLDSNSTIDMNVDKILYFMERYQYNDKYKKYIQAYLPDRCFETIIL